MSSEATKPDVRITAAELARAPRAAAPLGTEMYREAKTACATDGENITALSPQKPPRIPEQTTPKPVENAPISTVPESRKTGKELQEKLQRPTPLPPNPVSVPPPTTPIDPGTKPPTLTREQRERLVWTGPDSQTKYHQEPAYRRGLESQARWKPDTAKHQPFDDRTADSRREARLWAQGAADGEGGRR